MRAEMPRDEDKFLGLNGDIPSSGLDPLRPHRRREAATDAEKAQTAERQRNVIALHDRIAEAEEELTLLERIEARREKAREVAELRRALAAEIAALRDLD